MLAITWHRAESWSVIGGFDSDRRLQHVWRHIKCDVWFLFIAKHDLSPPRFRCHFGLLALPCVRFGLIASPVSLYVGLSFMRRRMLHPRLDESLILMVRKGMPNLPTGSVRVPSIQRRVRVLQ